MYHIIWVFCLLIRMNSVMQKWLCMKLWTTRSNSSSLSLGETVRWNDTRWYSVVTWHQMDWVTTKVWYLIKGKHSRYIRKYFNWITECADIFIINIITSLKNFQHCILLSKISIWAVTILHIFSFRHFISEPFASDVSIHNSEILCLRLS